MDIPVAGRLQHTDEYYFSKKLREIEEMNRRGKRVINLGVGNPDMAPHPEVVRALQEAAAKPEAHGYQGYKGVPALRGAMAAWYERHFHATLDADTEIMPLIGSKEGIVHVCMTYLQAGDEVLVPNPGYPAYAAAARLAGAAVLPYELREENGWQPDLAVLEKTDLSRVKMMWLNYPHMPTGAQAGGGLFEEVVAFGRRHSILICHDNPYSFILNDRPQSLLSVAGAKEVAVELNSLSKSANMAGWRVGMLAASGTRINDILRFKSNMDSGMFLPVQLAAARALGLDASWYARLNAEYARRREKVFRILDLLGCACRIGQVGLFVWARIPARYANGYALSDAVLHQARVFVTPGGIFGSAGMRYIRVSLCAKEAVLEEALARLRSGMEL